MIPFKINEQEVEAQEGWTVLETAKQYGIHIPTLCYHERSHPAGPAACASWKFEKGTGPRWLFPACIRCKPG